MARSYDRPAPFKTSHPFRSAPPYRHVQSEAELADDYLRMIGADPRPELGQYEGTPIPGVRRKAIPPADLDEQFKRGRTASVHMKQRRQAKKSSHRKMNPTLPSGDLTVHLADGSEVRTTPAFVDANGKLFNYDDYIKGALIHRFPKDESIPFYAFTLNQKADALFEKLGNWAKKGGTDPGGIWNRYCKVEDYVSNSRLAALTMDELKSCVGYAGTFPTLQEFNAAPDNNVSGDTWLKVTHYWRGFLGKKAVMDNWRWDGKYPTGSPLEYAALIAAFIKVAGVDPVVQRSKGSYLDTMPVNVLIAVSREWDKYLADPAFKAEADAILARSQQAEAERKAAWEARGKSTPASASSSFSTSSASSSTAPAATGSYSTPSTEITGMQYAQAMALNETLFGRKNPMARIGKLGRKKKNPFMVTTGGQAVPADPRQRTREQSVSDFIEHGTPMSLAGGGHRVPRKVQGLEERGTRYRIVRGSDGRFHIVDAATGTPTGKYGMTAESAQKVLEKLIGRANPAPSLDRAAEAVIAELSKRIKRQKVRRNPSPVPGISVEEVIADVQGAEWANWAYNRAGIMHWR